MYIICTCKNCVSHQCVKKQINTPPTKQKLATFFTIIIELCDLSSYTSHNFSSISKSSPQYLSTISVILTENWFVKGQLIPQTQFVSYYIPDCRFCIVIVVVVNCLTLLQNVAFCFFRILQIVFWAGAALRGGKGGGGGRSPTIFKKTKRKRRKKEEQRDKIEKNKEKIIKSKN